MKIDKFRCLVLGLLGVLCLSPDALLIRLYPGDSWNFIVLRSFGVALFVGILICLIPKGRQGFRWMPVLLYGMLIGGGTITFPHAIHQTSVANVLVVLASSPLIAAILGIWFVRDPIPRRLWITSTIIFIAVGSIFFESLIVGNILGDILALATALILALEALLIRKFPSINFFPGIFFGGLFSGTVACFFADIVNFEFDGWWVGAGNAFLLSFAFILIIMATRYLTAPEVNLIFLLETVLSPIWIFVAFAIVPSKTTVWAGVVILGALFFYYGSEMLPKDPYLKIKMFLVRVFLQRRYIR